MKRSKEGGAVCAVWVLFFVFALGCGREESKPAPPPSAVESPRAPPKPVEPPPWFAGSWQAEVQLRALAPALMIDALARRPNTKKGKAEEAAPSENGLTKNLSLRLSVGEGREVSGEGQLESQKLSVTGLVDDEVLRLAVSGAEVRGTLTAERKGDDFSGRIRLSWFEQSGRKHKAVAYEGDVKLSSPQ